MHRIMNGIWTLIIVANFLAFAIIVKYELLYMGCWIFAYWYIFLSLLLILSLIYIAILKCARRYPDLFSTIENKRHEYILHQTISIVVYKLISFSIAGFLRCQQAYDIENIEEIAKFDICPYCLWFIIFDTTTTPALIQVSYLMSHRRNIHFMWHRVSLKNLMKDVMTVISRKNRVAPVDVQLNGTTNQVGNN